VPADSSLHAKPLSRNIRVFGFTSLLNDTASEMAYWVLPAFLSSIGAGPAQLGIIEGIAESVASFAKLFSGYLADHVPRRKPVVVSGYVVANAVKPLLALAASWWHVLAIRFADRLAKGVRGAPRDVMAVESVDRSKIGSTYGFIQAMDSAGSIAGPLLALCLLPHYGLRGIFWLAAVPGALCVAVAFLGIQETRRAITKPGEVKEEHPSAPGRLSRSFYLVLFTVTLFSLGNSSDMFLVLRAQDVGVPVSHAPLLGLVFNITYTLFSWPAGRLSDRLSRYGMAAGGYLVYAIVYFAFAAAPSAAAVWTAMAFYGLFYALTNPVLKALVVETVGPEVRGRALGIYSFATSLAILLASVLAGELWRTFGPRLPFYFSAAVAAGSAFLLLGVSRVAPKPSSIPA
jgi:MFS family permease